jgi:hypothetical protein
MADSELAREVYDDPMDVLKKILEELTLDANFNGVGADKPG